MSRGYWGVRQSTPQTWAVHEDGRLAIYHRDFLSLRACIYISVVPSFPCCAEWKIPYSIEMMEMSEGSLRSSMFGCLHFCFGAAFGYYLMHINFKSCFSFNVCLSHPSTGQYSWYLSTSLGMALLLLSLPFA